MYELVREEFHRVKPLLKGGHLHPECVSVIELNNPGWIFVDAEKNPKSALIWSKGIRGFYLVGDHRNEAFVRMLDDFIKKDVEPRMRESQLNHFEVSGHHDEWNLESIFPARKLYAFEQLVYSMMAKSSVRQSNEIATINLKTDDWDNAGFQNTELINNHLRLFWSSIDEFKQKGFGYATVEGKHITGVCYASFVTKDTHAIGIETNGHHRNKGVGTHLASQLVEELQRNGFTPYWDCSLDNEPSKKLAERLGFKLIHRYTCRGFEI